MSRPPEHDHDGPQPGSYDDLPASPYDEAEPHAYGSEPAAADDTAAADAPAPDPEGEGWQRLDKRMLLLGPIDALKQFAVPAIIAVVGLSTSRGSFEGWLLIPAALGAIILGVIPWLTTRYRFTETQFQLHKGLISRSQVTAPLDRVRSVDLESSVIHRILGISKVKIGTGVDDTQIELRAVSQAAAAELRHRLLQPRAVPGRPVGPGGEDPGDEGDRPAAADAAPEPAEELAAFDWSWVRFAPFSLSRLVVVAAAVGVLAQFGDSLPIFERDNIESAWAWVTSFAISLVIIAVVLGAVVGWLLISLIGYVVQWYGFRLTRERGSLHVAAGLFTTRSTTVEEARVRGVRLVEPWLMRPVHGSELAALCTGVGSGGVTPILPPAPTSDGIRVGHDALGPSGLGVLTVPLSEHGPEARRRCFFRALRPPAAVALVVAGLSWWRDWAWWWPTAFAVIALALGLLAGATAYRNLGHGLGAEHLVSGDGTFDRRRTVLETDGIIGWVIQQSWFQRRLGLATLKATTAAGSEYVAVRDIGLERAVALADHATPGMLTPFLHGVPSP